MSGGGGGGEAGGGEADEHRDSGQTLQLYKLCIRMQKKKKKKKYISTKKNQTSHIKGITFLPRRNFSVVWLELEVVKRIRPAVNVSLFVFYD